MRFKMKLRFLFTLLALAAAGLLSGFYIMTAAAAADHVVYDDALGDNWSNWSWGTAIQFDYSRETHSGGRAISVRYNQAWAGFFLHSNQLLSGADYTALRFAIHGGTNGNHALRVALVDGNNDYIGTVSVRTVAGAWTEVEIPLAEFGAVDTISGVAWQEYGGRRQERFLLDSISFVGTGDDVPPPPTESTIPIYEDNLAAGWADSSWGTDLNLAATGAVQQGARAISVQYKQLWGAFFIKRDTPLALETDDTLQFWLFSAADAAQVIKISLVDAAGGFAGRSALIETQPNTWRQVTIPVADLGGPSSISGLLFQEDMGRSQPAYVLDQIVIKRFGAPPPPAPTDEPLPSPTNEPTATAPAPTVEPSPTKPGIDPSPTAPASPTPTTIAPSPTPLPTGQPSPTAPPPTPTLRPSLTPPPPTATAVPPTATAVPPTATAAPPTATVVPPTPTVVPSPTAPPPPPPPPPAGTFVETFDGDPASPLPWRNSSVWDVAVHSRDLGTWYQLETMQAQHGPNCEPPDATHPNNSYEGAVFQCKNHVMTAITAGGYGMTYLTPNVQADFSNGTAVVRWDMSTFRASGRDWIDLWISPFEDNLITPLEEWYPDGSGEPFRAIHIRMEPAHSEITGGSFKAFVINGHSQVELPLNSYVNYTSVLEPSATRRDTFELQISQTHIKFGMPAYNLWWIDTNVAPLGWTSGVVQLGHHSYTPEKACEYNGRCGPGTWHWDNVQVSPAVPFTMIHANQRYINGGSDTATFTRPAPANAYLRFNGIGEGLQVSFDGGAWQTAAIQRQEKYDGGAFRAYWMPIPAGTQSVRVRGGNWWGGGWHARSISIWSRDYTGAALPVDNFELIAFQGSNICGVPQTSAAALPAGMIGAPLAALPTGAGDATRGALPGLMAAVLPAGSRTATGTRTRRPGDPPRDDDGAMV